MEPIKGKLGKIVDRTGSHITGIFFSVDKNNDNERAGEDDVYALDIVMLKNSESDPHEASDAAVRARREISDLFKREFKKGDGYKNIELDHCEPISDLDFTIRHSWRLREWTG